MIDEEIKQTFKELKETLNPKAVRKIESHIMSLGAKINDLIKSRDAWKNKYMKLEEDLKND